MRRIVNYEVQEFNTPSITRGLEDVFIKTRSMEEAIDMQKGGSWLDTCTPDPSPEHRFIVRDYKYPQWKGTEYYTREEALQALTRMNKSAYIYYYVPDNNELEEDDNARKAEARWLSGFGA